MILALLFNSFAHATPPTIEQIWKRADLVSTCPHGEDLERFPPETAMKKLEAISYLTSEEVALLRKTLAEKFDDVYLYEIPVNKSDCAEARLRLGKAARRGSRSLAPRLRAILEKPKASTLMNLAIDVITLQEGLREKFFDAPKDLLAEVTKFKLEMKQDINEINSGFEKFEHEEFMLWEPSPLAVAKFKALPELKRYRELVLREHDVVEKRTKQFQELLGKLNHSVP